MRKDFELTNISLFWETGCKKDCLMSVNPNIGRAIADLRVFVPCGRASGNIRRGRDRTRRRGERSHEEQKNPTHRRHERVAEEMGQLRPTSCRRPSGAMAATMSRMKRSWERKPSSVFLSIEETRNSTPSTISPFKPCRISDNLRSQPPRLC